MEPFFQVGIIVQDLERAMEELSRAQDIRWGKVADRKVGDWQFRRVFSMEGPPYIELIQGPPGSPWDASAGPRLDHLQWWTDDLERDSRKYAAAGLTLDTDGTRFGGLFRYFQAPATGMRLELIDASLRPAHRQRWGIEEAPADGAPAQA